MSIYDNVKHPLTPVIKKKWLKSLRSGEYKQGDGRLMRLSSGVPEYCCLGVLQEVAPLPEVTDDEFLEGRTSGRKQYYRLSGTVQDTLAEMNDNSGMSFAKIADYIEKNIPAYGEEK